MTEKKTIEVYLYDDGKRKYGSFRVRCQHEVKIKNTPAWANLYFEAYGDTEQEAMENLDAAISCAREDLHELDFKVTEVDWNDEPIQARRAQ